MTSRTRFLIALSSAIGRAAARLDKERLVPIRRVKVKGTGEKAGKPAEYMDWSQVPFWEAVVEGYEWLLDRVARFDSEDARLVRMTELGPWTTLVSVAQRDTGLTTYGAAILAFSARLRAQAENKATDVLPENVVQFGAGRWRERSDTSTTATPNE